MAAFLCHSNSDRSCWSAQEDAPNTAGEELGEDESEGLAGSFTLPPRPRFTAAAPRGVFFVGCRRSRFLRRDFPSQDLQGLMF